MRVVGLGWAGIPMQDFAGAVRFFSQVVQMPPDRVDASEESARFRLPAGHVLEVFGPNHPRGRLTPHVIVAFDVDDVRQTRRAFEADGIAFLNDAPGEAAAYFRGPDGYLYEIWKPGEPAAAGRQDAP